jgi:hypothetical protein
MMGHPEGVEGTFEVETPANPDMTEQSLGYHWTNPDGTYKTFELQQLASDPWEVDILLSFSDYQLHFDQARLVRPGPGGDTLILYGEWLAGIDEGRLPAGFHVARVTRQMRSGFHTRRFIILRGGNHPASAGGGSREEL